MLNFKINSNFLYLMLLFGFLLLGGCKDRKSIIADKVVTFRKETAIDFSNSNFFKNKTVVQLETNENSLIPGFSSVKKDDNNFFVYNNDSSFPILRFDINGTFINKIGSRGNGPNEFTRLLDTYINKTKCTVELLTDQKVIRFSYDGVPINSTGLSIPAGSFTVSDDFYWFYTGNNRIGHDHRLYLTDQNFQIINKFLKDKTNLLPYIEDNFYQSPHTTFRETFYRNIYKIKGDSLLLSYTLEFPGMEYPSEIHKMNPNTVLYYIRSLRIADLRCFLENNNYIYMFVYELSDENEYGIFYHWIIDKNNNYQEKIIKIIPSDILINSYLCQPQLLTDENLLYLMGYIIENENDDADEFINTDLNPAIVIVNIADIFD